MWVPRRPRPKNLWDELLRFFPDFTVVYESTTLLGHNRSLLLQNACILHTLTHSNAYLFIYIRLLYLASIVTQYMLGFLLLITFPINGQMAQLLNTHIFPSLNPYFFIQSIITFRLHGGYLLRDHRSRPSILCGTVTQIVPHNPVRGILMATF